MHAYQGNTVNPQPTSLMIFIVETQRDIIANNQQYNNRFNYAVSSKIKLFFFFEVTFSS